MTSTVSQLTAKDHTYLESLLNAASGDEIFQQLLRRKLDTADVVLAQMIDPRIATIDSRIVFSVGGGSSEERVLTRDAKSAAQGVPLPVTTLRGLALLGLREGDVFALRTPSGIIEPLKLEKVSYQPQREKRRLAAGPTVVAFPPLAATVRGAARPPDDDPGPPAA